ncbi:hypothetical protein ACWELJ_25905 [Nocardia sp. NPDC004582]
MTAEYLRQFTLFERALISSAADHFAADYYGNEFHPHLSDTAKAVAAAYLRAVTATHGTDTVADAVTAYLTDHPEALTRTDRDRERHTYNRDSEWQRLITAAAQAFTAGNLTRARRLVDDAETAQPCRSVAAYRRRITKAANAGAVR